MGKLITFQIFMFTLLFSFIFSVGYFYQNKTVQTIEVTVTDKQRITNGSDSKYIVFTDKETFENTDAFFHQKYDSSDVYSRLKVDCSYNMDVYGWRVPFISLYRNIIKINKEESCS